MRIGIVAGETSGDQLAADLILALRKKHPDLIVEGIAGPRLIEAGCKPLFPMEKIAVMGLFEVLGSLPTILQIRHQLIEHFIANPPDIFIGVDAPDFNLTVEEKLRKQGIKTVHYVSPSVWAWRQGRLKKIKRADDLMLTLLPFEAQFYEKNNIPVQFVGHYLADRISIEIDRNAARQALQLPQEATIVALLPGSRANEIKYLGETFIRAAQLCAKQMPNLIFVAPMINQERRQQFETILQQIAPGFSIKLVDEKSQLVMQAADAILLASGTATLEAMLFKRPMVVAYRMSNLTYAIAKRLIKVPYISLPNLLASKKLVPELIQEAATPENLAQALLDYLQNPQKVKELQSEFIDLHKKLRLNASEHAADAILNLIK